MDYGRDRLASLAILCRGLHLCDQPFAVIADPSWQQTGDEYPYFGSRPDAFRTGWTDAANAPNGNDVYKNTHSMNRKNAIINHDMHQKRKKWPIARCIKAFPTRTGGPVQMLAKSKESWWLLRRRFGTIDKSLETDQLHSQGKIGLTDYKLRDLTMWP